MQQGKRVLWWLRCIRSCQSGCCALLCHYKWPRLQLVARAATELPDSTATGLYEVADRWQTSQMGRRPRLVSNARAARCPRQLKLILGVASGWKWHQTRQGRPGFGKRMNRLVDALPIGVQKRGETEPPACKRALAKSGSRDKETKHSKHAALVFTQTSSDPEMASE